MELYADTVIIGAGPAGASCAITLQNNNAPCLLIDKKTFPRDKTCGGLVTEKTYVLLKELLGDGADGLFCSESSVVELHYKDKRLTRSNVTKKFRFVKRSVLDDALVTEYKRLGGKMLEGCAPEKIDPDAKRVFLSNGDSVKYERLVGADGAKSAVRRALGVPEPQMAFCVESRLPRDAFNYDGAVRIYFGVVKKGYAWVFPSGDKICIGLGGIYKEDARYDVLLKDFLRKLGAKGEFPMKGAFVPYGETVDQTSLPSGAVLIGDAAGLADPLSGEGLYFALSSGMEAAGSAISAGEGFRKDLLERIAPLAQIVKEGESASNSLFLPGALLLFSKMMAGKDGFAAFVCDELISVYNYSYSELKKMRDDYRKK